MKFQRIANTVALAPLAAGIAIPISASAAAPDGAARSGVTRVVSCSTYSDYPNTEITSARGMTCKNARNVMKGYHGNISRTFSAPRGFRCTRVSGVAEGGQWRCTRQSQAFRFQFKD